MFSNRIRSPYLVRSHDYAIMLLRSNKMKHQTTPHNLWLIIAITVLVIGSMFSGCNANATQTMHVHTSGQNCCVYIHYGHSGHTPNFDAAGCGGSCIIDNANCDMTADISFGDFMGVVVNNDPFNQNHWGQPGYWGVTNSGVPTADLDFYANSGSGTAQPCTTGGTIVGTNNTFWCCVNVRNTDGICHLYGAYTNNVLWAISQPIWPGGTFHQCITSSVPVSCYTETYFCYGEPFPTGTNGGTSGTNSNSGPPGGSGGGGNTGGGTQPPQSVYTGGTNGINWTNSGPLNTTNVVQIGDSAIYDELVKFANQNHADLNMLRTSTINVNLTNNLFVSNNITVTNNIAGTTNGISTNQLDQLVRGQQQGQSNKIASATTAMQSVTNGAASLDGGTLKSAASGLGDLGSAAGSGGAASFDFPIGGSSPMAMTITTSDQTYFHMAAVKTALSWGIYLALFIANYKVFRVAMVSAAVAPQARTAGEEILGNNVNFASALVVAALIIAAVAVIPAFALSQLVSWMGNLSGGPFSGLTSLPTWGWVTSSVPIGLMATSIGVHIVFRVAVDFLSFVVIGIIRFLVGL
jgi:hypothetical protein